jgi:hypothetical protein
MERLPIDVRLWALASGALFVGLLCIDAAGCFNAERNLAHDVRQLRTSGYSSRGRMEDIAAQSLLYAGVAFVVGWALHGIAVVCGVRFRRWPNWENQLDFQDPQEAGIGPEEPWNEKLSRLAELRQKGELLRRGRQRSIDQDGSSSDDAGR